MISRDDRAIDVAFWRERLERAIGFREILEIDATAYRLVHGEADLLPSLVVDRYGDYLVMQALSQGMDRLTPTLVPLLVELTGAKGVLARNDPEGAPARRPRAESRGRARRGARDHRRARRRGVTYDVDPWRGQKTGLFLDQRENRRGGRALRARRVARLFQLQRRLRAGAGAALPDGGGARRLGRRRGPHHRQRRRQRPRQPHRPRGQRVRRAAAPRTRGRPLRHHRAGPAGLRQEQGRRSRTPWPATRKSTSGPCACWRPAAT